MAIDGHFREKRLKLWITETHAAAARRTDDWMARVDNELEKSSKDSLSGVRDILSAIEKSRAEFLEESVILRNHTQAVVAHKKGLDDSSHVSQVNPRRAVTRG